MKTCYKCGKPTIYEMSGKSICFNCIKQLELDRTLDAIIKEAEATTGVSFNDMRIKTRKREIVDARRYTMKLLYESDAGTLSYVGGLFDQDHATVLIGIKTINSLLETGQVEF